MGKVLLIAVMAFSLFKVHAIEKYDVYLKIPEGSIVTIYDVKNLNYLVNNEYDIASTLESYIILENQAYLIQTEEHFINDLVCGEYLFTFTNSYYHIESLYLKLDHDIDVFPKTIEKQGKNYDLTVNKQWVGRKMNEVTIFLYENNSLIDQFILSKDNNYTHCIKNLNDNHHYVLVEENNEAYNYFIDKEDYCYTITNIENHIIEELPQTGMPIIYIPFFLFMGIICLIISLL